MLQDINSATNSGTACGPTWALTVKDVLFSLSPQARLSARWRPISHILSWFVSDSSHIAKKDLYSLLIADCDS